jgi:hypothetical protein
VRPLDLRPHLPGLLALIAAGLLVLWPVLPGLEGLVGDPLGETDNHLWMFWSTLGGAPANAPAPLGLPLMDPVNLPAYALGALASPAAGWAVLRLWNVALAMAGGAALSRCFVSGPAVWVGAAVLGTAPFLAGVMDFGITESWPIGWFALHAAALIACARHGGVGRALLAGACLGMVALSGWYHALFGLVLEAALVPALLWRHRRPAVVLQGGVALAMVLPALVRFLSVADGFSARWRAPAPGPPGPRPDWAELPVFGTDLLNFALPQLDAVHPSKSVYLGLVALLLCVLGLLRRPRVAGPLLLLAVPFGVLALGHWPTLAGKALGFPGPAWFLAEHIPPLRGLSHWHRAIAGGIPFVAVAAAVGAEGLLARLPRGASLAGAALVLLVAADGIVGGGTAWPRSTIALEAPAVLAELPGAAGVVQLPFDNGRAPFSTDPARIYQRWQVAHGRAISENYEGVDALLARSALVAAADASCGVETTLPPYYQPPPEMRDLPMPTGAELVAAREALRGWGYAHIVVHRGRCRTPVQAIQALDQALGPGTHHAGGDVVWAL